MGGRVVLVNYGPDAGKLGMITDVIDQNRCMVYSPYTSLPRQEMTYKRLSLTDLKLRSRGAHAPRLPSQRGRVRMLTLSGLQPAGPRRWLLRRGRQPCRISNASRQ